MEPYSDIDYTYLMNSLCLFLDDFIPPSRIGFTF